MTAAVLGATVAVAAGCGEMTIRTWVLIDEDNSGGDVAIQFAPGATPLQFDLVRLQGGFLSRVDINTAALPGTMYGTLTLEDVRIAGEVSGTIVGKLCTWNDPEGVSGGDISIDLLGGVTRTDLFLDAKARTQVQDALGMDPVDFEEEIDFDLGDGLGINEFVAAFNAGSPAGLFSTQTSISSTVDMGGIQSTFTMDAAVVNGSLPPTFDADLLDYCQDNFDSQVGGKEIFYGMNTKSSYMRRAGNDTPLDPLVIPLAEVGAAPGDVVRLKRVGTWATLIAFANGPETSVGGVFSSTDEILPWYHLDRIPGAIDVAPDLNSWWSIVCFLGNCADWGGDEIPEDFPIYGTTTISVPAGAAYLFVAPVDGLRRYADNTGMGLGVSVEVNP